jgi:hypothetical protein
MVRGHGSQPDLREEQAGLLGVEDRLGLPLMSGCAGGGKDPEFWRVIGSDQESRNWDRPINSIQ